MSTAPDAQELKMAAAEDRKRKSEDEDGEGFDDDEGDEDDSNDDSYDSEEGSDSEDDEELKALQQLSDQIQEAKATNQKLKETLLTHHQNKKLKRDEPDHSQRDFVEALFETRKADQAKKEGDTIV